MDANKMLKHLFFISSSFGLLLAAILLMGAPEGAERVLLYSTLLPLGLGCPLLAGGCLLHDRLESRRPGAALLLRFGGAGLFWSAAAFIIRRHCG